MGLVELACVVEWISRSKTPKLYRNDSLMLV